MGRVIDLISHRNKRKFMEKFLIYLQLFYMLDEEERESIKKKCKDVWRKHSKEEAITILNEVRKRVEENLM